MTATNAPAEQADATPAAPEADGTTEQVTEATEATEAPAQQTADDGFESLSESWQREIKALRKENAERRTNYNDLKAQLDAAKTQEDIDAAVGEYKNQVVELERSLAFERHTAGLPDEARELVVGQTEDEIKASADKVRKLLEGAAGQQANEPDLEATGGLNPRGNQSGAGQSPRDLARAALNAGRRR